MSVLPVPAELYFSDFAFDLVKYDVVRDGTHIATAKGLTNSDKTGNFISFPIDVDLQVGDVLQTKRQRFIVKSIDYGIYEGEEQIINAYY